MLDARYLPRCYQDDPNISDCFISAANSLNENVRSGISEIGLRPLDSFVSPDFNLTLESPISDVYVAFKRFTLYQVHSYRFTTADVRPKDGVLEGQVMLSELGMSANFEAQGHVVGVALNGLGYGRIGLENVACDFSIKWPKEGTCNELNLEISCKIEDLKVSNITGLPGADSIRAVLNLSSQLIASEAAPACSSIFQALLKSYLRRLCRQYAFNDLFPMNQNA
ncbi:hypothetical protein PPYR_02777 [Photinus pyralis]|uniref:Hemolymph juvenile hormone-binding protein n=2 Tax=Photinus pyralis TaxID=7054 RepID=A0A5N4A0W5_PHOPY|nr:uncharacterized protein LOC116161968 isoform X2 [Photinus pyralis]KAB0790977.1 hypothetical protein PPYR_02777 [Photinus pyralis]